MQMAMTPKNIRVWKVHYATYRRSGRRFFTWSTAWEGGGIDYRQGKGIQAGIFDRAVELIVYRRN